MKNYSAERDTRAKEELWAIEDIYPDTDAWRRDLEKLKTMAQKPLEYRGRLSESAKTLLEFMQLDDACSMLAHRVHGYASRLSDQDTRIAAHQGMVSEATSAFIAFAQSTSFATPEILAIPEETIEQFYRDEPALETYRRAIYKIRRRREHVLSEAEENLLAGADEMAQGPETVYAVFANSDLTFPDVEDSAGEKHALSAATYITYLSSPDRVLRKNAFHTLYTRWGEFRNAVAAILCSQVKQLQFFANARHYPDSLSAALDVTEVPTQVYHNLIDAVHANFDKMHRYMALRKKLMGVDELHMYDIYTPMVPDADVEVTMDEAKQTVYEALSPLGERYRAILKEGFENRWMDCYPNPGKRSGAYSSGEQVHPFVLMNYNGNLDDMFTLAHEFGHAIHSYLSTKTQPFVNSNYVIFVAEVASTCNEALLMQYLLGKTTDKKQRAYLINHFLEQFRTTLYRQTMFAEFEMKLGELNQAGVPLTAEKLSEVYYDLNKQYYGDAIICDEEIAMEWARVPHFYYNYYVFQYATGYSAAIALSQRILKEGAPAVEDYLNFLSGGSSKDPISLLRGAGVDMATTKPVNDALTLFGELLDEMESLMAD